MNETIHERIEALVRLYGEGKNTVFAYKLGISEGNIRGYIKGVMPKQDVLEKIVRTFDVNSNWLLTGIGEPSCVPLDIRMGKVLNWLGLFKAATLLEVDPTELGKFCNGGELPKSPFNFANLLKEYPDISDSWLIYGIGDSIRGDGSALSKEQRFKKHIQEEGQKVKNKEIEKEIPIAIPSTIPNEGIPLIPIEAMAGALTSEQTVLEYECERYVVPMFKGADFLIPVKGSSMYPKYSSGDIVACQRVSMSDLFFQWNKVYVIDTNQGALIKRIKPGSDKDHVLIVSDNEKYDPFELPFSAIHAVALVIGVIRLE